MPTTGAFYTYNLFIASGQASLYQNGALLGSLGLGQAVGTAFNEFYFADGTGSGSSESLTRFVSSEPVPEPASLAALGLGTLALLRRRRAV